MRHSTGRTEKAVVPARRGVCRGPPRHQRILYWAGAVGAGAAGTGAGGAGVAGTVAGAGTSGDGDRFSVPAVLLGAPGVAGALAGGTTAVGTWLRMAAGGGCSRVSTVNATDVRKNA